MRAIALLLLAVSAVHAEDPLRITVLTRLNQALPEAHRRFVERWGEGRIELRYGDFEAPPKDWEK